MKRPACFSAALGLMILATLCFVGASARHRAGECCALDGGALDAVSRVRLVDERGKEVVCCSFGCAELWQSKTDSPMQAFVYDETSGREIAAEAAYFVRSLVVTNRATGNRIHAFAERDDAMRHARTCRGTLLTGDQRPLQAKVQRSDSNLDETAQSPRRSVWGQ